MASIRATLGGLHPALDAGVAARFDPQQAIDRRDGVNGTATTAVTAQLERARAAAAANRGSMGE
jgi:hypothetical protein